MHSLLEEQPLGIVNKLHLVVLATAVCLSMVAVTFEHKLHIVVLGITVCLSMGPSDLWARCCLSYNFCGLGDTEVCNLKNSKFISSTTPLPLAPSGPQLQHSDPELNGAGQGSSEGGAGPHPPLHLLSGLPLHDGRAHRRGGRAES